MQIRYGALKAEFVRCAGESAVVGVSCVERCGQALVLFRLLFEELLGGHQLRVGETFADELGVA